MNLQRRWFVVCTGVKAEGRVAWTLEALNFDVFLPMETRMRVIRGKRIRVQNPLFSRYVFVGFDPQREEWYWPIRSIDGVMGLLENNQMPVPVPTIAIEELRRLEANGAFDKSKLPAAGEVFRVVAGPFADLIGKVKNARASGRVRLLLEMLGKVVEANFPIEQLERATDTT